jgi:transposase
MTMMIIGIDLGKTVCSLAGLDKEGRVVFRKRVRRDRLSGYLANLPPSRVVMEACCGAHHAAREAIALGHEARLMPPEYVRPYVKAQKNDDRDAEGVAEAGSRPTMRFVAVKSEAQLDLQTLHRVRARLVARRTAVINQLRAILLERGVRVARGKAKLAKALPDILAQETTPLRPRIRLLIEEMRAEWRGLDERIEALDHELASAARQDQAARRLSEVPGIGPLTATALVAAVGTAEGFQGARDLSAWLGLVPRQATTGGKPRLLGITKRGNKYLRYLLVHGARSVMGRLSEQSTALGRWLRKLLARVHPNVAVVALANKLARIAWAVLAKGVRYAAA